MKIDEIIFNEIKSAQEDGLTSKGIAEEMDLDIEQVNKVLSSRNFKEFSTGEISIDTSLTILKPKDKGFIRQSLKPKDANLEISNQERAKQLVTLNKQIQVSWDMIKLLEKRKNQLSQDINQMEDYIRNGINLSEKYVEE